MGSWETLDSILEVGIGIAGFSGVVVAFGRGEWSTRAIHLLPTLLDLSFVVIVLSFIPMIMLSTDMQVSSVWRASSTLTALYIAAVLPYRAMRMRRLGLERTGLSRYLGVGLNSLALLLSFANIFWIQAPWPHLVSLVLMLVLAFGVFSYLVTELWTSPIHPTLGPTLGPTPGVKQ